MEPDVATKLYDSMQHSIFTCIRFVEITQGMAHHTALRFEIGIFHEKRIAMLLDCFQ